MLIGCSWGRGGGELLYTQMCLQLDDDVCLCPGEFSGEELLKLWKGLFYCLWMQDKPLLQEELSRKISTLIHSFTSTQQQLSYLRSFLQTMKREWTGIDRLRMDKFFQLVRFVFRQTFEMLRRRSLFPGHFAVSQFLELLTAQLLQSDAAAPSGLQLHVLDLYLTELAVMGAAELTADQNLTFIEPFCRTAARTKDRTLLSGICSSVFSTIINQAPFAIDDLMKEVRASEDSDSGQASEGDEEEEGDEKTMKMEKSVPADEEQAAEAPQLTKKKTKKKGKEEMTAGVTAAETPQKKDQQEAPEEEEVQKEARKTPGKKKKKKKSVTQEAAEAQVGGKAGDTVASLDRETPTRKKKRKIPVVFEFEADELQTLNGIAAEEEETATKKPRRTSVSV
uniref:Ribosomal RNA processing protein 1 homolog B-like n=1 Tax=Neolamprologus brichardi TaxID=32507 RepID=A0A3Q4HXZ4_NEOBR